MAMGYEHTRLVYKAKTKDKLNYIDLTRGLALINGKNCSQFSSKDKPRTLLVSIRLDSSGETIRAAKSTWVVRNACVKAAAAWRRTLRSAGIRRKKQLNTYARNPRFAMNAFHSLTFGGMLDAISDSNADLIPEDVDVRYGTGVYTSAGDEIMVYAYNGNISGTGGTPWSDSVVKAFTQTTFAVPQSGATDVMDKQANLLGDADAAYSNVVAEYIDSRINDADIEDTDLDESPSNDNDFVMMLAPGEEVADDVLDNVDDEGKWRPYTLHTSTTACTVVQPDANVAGQDTVCEVPLGLLEWNASDISSQIVIDVLAISDM